MDQMMGNFTTATKCNCWTIKMMSYVLDVTRVNAQSVLCFNTGKKPHTGLDSFKFEWDLAMELLPHLKSRMNLVKRKKTLLKIHLFVDDEREDIEYVEEDEEGGGDLVEPGAGGGQVG